MRSSPYHFERGEGVRSSPHLVRDERGLYHHLSFREKSIEEIISLSCKREEEGVSAIIEFPFDVREGK
jgi:hypothetical protein